MVVRGRVIQAFDAKKRQPEIIRAEEIFVGEGGPRDFVIYYSERDYLSDIKLHDLVKLGTGPLCPGARHYRKLGQTFDRLVLMPASASEHATTKGKWSFHFWENSVLHGAGLDMLLQEANRLHRLNARPPKSKRWGDCMECVPKGER